MRKLLPFVKLLLWLCTEKKRPSPGCKFQDFFFRAEPIGPLDRVANKLETFKKFHVYASLMKYMDFNSLDSAFDVDPIYFWSYTHQTFLVSMSHPSFTLII